MSLDAKEKKYLGAVIAVILVAAVWYIASTFVIPRIEAARQLAEAQERQVTMGEGEAFAIEGRQGNFDSDDSELRYQSGDFSGTLNVCVNASRLYPSKSAMEEAEGFSGDLDEISYFFDEEPLALVVDVSITNEDATNSKFEGFPTYFTMDFFGIQYGEASSAALLFSGQDQHVPEYYQPETKDDYWSYVDIPQGETVSVRLAFLIPPSDSVKEEYGSFSQLLPAYGEGDRILFYYGQLDFSSIGVTDTAIAPDFAVSSAYIPYLVELSPEVM